MASTREVEKKLAPEFTYEKLSVALTKYKESPKGWDQILKGDRPGIATIRTIHDTKLPGTKEVSKQDQFKILMAMIKDPANDETHGRYIAYEFLKNEAFGKDKFRYCHALLLSDALSQETYDAFEVAKQFTTVLKEEDDMESEENCFLRFLCNNKILAIPFSIFCSENKDTVSTLMGIVNHIARLAKKTDMANAITLDQFSFLKTCPDKHKQIFDKLAGMEVEEVPFIINLLHLKEMASPPISTPGLQRLPIAVLKGPEGEEKRDAESSSKAVLKALPPVDKVVDKSFSPMVSPTSKLPEVTPAPRKPLPAPGSLAKQNIHRNIQATKAPEPWQTQAVDDIYAYTVGINAPM